MDHLKRLGELGYQSFAHKSMTEKALKSHQDSLDSRNEERKDDPSFGLSTQLPVRIVRDKPRDIYPLVGHGAVDKKHMEILAELDRRLQAQLMSLVFETLESFFKEFAGKLFFLTRNEATGTSIKLTHRRSEFRKYLGPTTKLKAGTPQYFDEYAQWVSRRNCDQLLKELCKAYEPFEVLARKNNSGTDLLDFFQTISFCRHRTVHVAGEVSATDLKVLPKHWADLLRKKAILGSKITKKETLLPDEPFVRWVIGRSASFIYLAYSVFSEELNLVVDIGPTT